MNKGKNPKNNGPARRRSRASKQVEEERDFTAGGIFSLPRTPGSTGDKEVDARVRQLVADWACGENSPLIEELIITSLRIGKDCLGEADLKLFNRALKEMRASSRVFHPYAHERKISIFGSARTEPGMPEFEAAKKFAEELQKKGFMTITGAGDGIMGAAQAGAGRDNSFGLNIKLPFEQSANEVIEGDHKLVTYNYFFTRKLAFVKEADAVALFPGGFGTMDEGFEVLTLIQTGKATIIPIVMVDPEGGTYWKTWLQFVRDHLLRLGLISAEDLYLFRSVQGIDAAVDEILNFYSNYHSYRFVRNLMVIRMYQALPAAEVSRLNEDFADILMAGEFKAGSALPEEANEDAILEMPRLMFQAKRGRAGRIRQLIDRINEFAPAE